MNKAIAIIPARGGSKRIPKKNIKEFHGKPLIAYSIQTALKSKLFDKVIVSTDDVEIAEISKKYGAEIPFLRPKELADDFCSSADAISYTLKELADNSFDYVCTIYPTAPLLQVKYLKEGLEKLQNSTAKNSFSVTTLPFPIQRTFKITQENRCEMFTPEYYTTRSQDLEEAYQDAAQFYWQKLRVEKSEVMFSQDSIPIVLPRYLVQDIDTLEDFKRAEVFYEIMQKEAKKS